MRRDNRTVLVAGDHRGDRTAAFQVGAEAVTVDVGAAGNRDDGMPEEVVASVEAPRVTAPDIVGGDGQRHDRGRVHRPGVRGHVNGRNVVGEQRRIVGVDADGAAGLVDERDAVEARRGQRHIDIVGRDANHRRVPVVIVEQTGVDVGRRSAAIGVVRHNHKPALVIDTHMGGGRRLVRHRDDGDRLRTGQARRGRNRCRREEPRLTGLEEDLGARLTGQATGDLGEKTLQLHSTLH